jgi:hypothetical protein
VYCASKVSCCDGSGSPGTLSRQRRPNYKATRQNQQRNLNKTSEPTPHNVILPTYKMQLPLLRLISR